MTKFDTTVQLSGEDGNAFSILGRVKRALEECGATKEECSAYHVEATSGDYENLLRVTSEWVDVS